ncbi:MAG: class I SAM-dependent methyltransferase [Candidatus Aenigmarchaeota archaeon]|nr:class I SAM-dependent methyltransferase [Candidatus Aenigmarchaeota archaeon]
MSPEEVLAEIERSGLSSAAVGQWGKHRPTTSHLPIIGREKGAVLVAAVQERRPRTILEVGTLVGYSAILMAMHAPQARITSLEVDPRAAAEAQKNLLRAGFADRVTVIVGDARETIPRLEGTFDLIFLDAGKEEYFAYLLAAEAKMAPGAVVVADNVKLFAKEMHDYLAYVRNSGKYESRCHDFGFDGVEVSRRR